MSDSIKIKLSKDEYNAVFAVCGTLSGIYGTVSSTKIRDIISSAAQSESNGKTLPENITVDLPKKVLDGVYAGLIEKVTDTSVTTIGLLQLKAVASLLKMGGRFEKYLEAEFLKIPDNSEEFDLEPITEPFDGE